VKALLLIHHPTQRPPDSETEKRRLKKEEVEKNIEKMRIERANAIEEAIPGIKMSSKDKKERSAILGETREKPKSKDKRHDSDDATRKKSPSRKERASDRKSSSKHVSDRSSRSEKKGEQPFPGVRMHRMHAELDFDEKREDAESEGDALKSGENEKGEVKIYDEREPEEKEGDKRKWTKSVWSLSPENAEVTIWRYGVTCFQLVFFFC
jgi:hypothetical protein